MLPNLNYLIDQVGKDKGIPKEQIIFTLETAMLKAAKKKFGEDGDIEAQYNEDLGEVELFQFKEVVENVENEAEQISLEEALELDPEVILGDSIGIKLDTTEFGRIAAQIAKQVIIQRVRSAERENIFNDYKDRKNELIAGTVRRVERNHIIVDLGRTEAIMYAKSRSPKDNYRPRDRILAYVEDVTTSTKGPQIILSRTANGLIKKLFEMEVPEIAEGIVQIRSVAREPGSRSKIAVISRDSDVDPVGACVGMKGTRVQNIVQELRGEKIDIVTHDTDPVRFVCNALAPAVVSQVLIDEEDHSMEITVPDDQLSLAIGKRGQNVRLASQLTGWKLDIQSESKVEKMAERAREVFQRMEGVDEELANTLTRLGFLTFEDLIRADLDDLRIIPGMHEMTAEQLVERATALEKLLKEEEQAQRKQRIAQPVRQEGDEPEEEEPKAEETAPEAKPESQPKEAAEKPSEPVVIKVETQDELLRLKNVDEELVDRLKEAGYYTIKDIADANFTPPEFSEKFGLSMRKTRGLLHSAEQKIQKLEKKEADQSDEASAKEDEGVSDDPKAKAEAAFEKKEDASEVEVDEEAIDESQNESLSGDREDKE